MRGVVFLGDRKVEVQDFPDPKPGPGEVVVAIKASGLCGSDLKFYREPAGAALKTMGLREGGDAEPPALIAGHEPCGVVEEVGEGVDAFAPGDRVIVFHYDGCGICDSCRTGWTQLCDRGAKIYGATANGGHADYILVPARTLVKMPDEVSFSAGAAIACGTGTAFAALQRGQLTGADTLVVYGMGPIGLSAVQFARAMGARVLAVDIAPDRLAQAKALGAEVVINSAETDPVAAVKEATGGKGATMGLDCSGATVARTAAVRSVDRWGRVVLVGINNELNLEASPDVIFRQITIIGSYTFSIVGMGHCARFVADHGVDVDAIFSDRWSIDDAVKAYEEFDKQTGGKAVIEF
ncbi:zinc-dependent alcohol dehydrogenase family protein [Gordonia sp. (in: high G+C Gram-positive bacteria)]|uniref:zinc-dependent alcohol dehydrogenase family protein n=1 Tax=Gordonia sp. (in: high G+C Gram-positive bacteria) TaxID=84139 RepID=UPI0039E583F2